MYRESLWFEMRGQDYADTGLQDDVVKARPDIDEKVTQLVSKGRWNVPGYKVRLLLGKMANGYLLIFNRRNLGISRSCRWIDTLLQDFWVIVVNAFHR